MDDYNTLKDRSGHLVVAPVTMAVDYLCNVPQRKAWSELVISILVANQIFMRALWSVFTIAASIWVKPKDETATWCEGCLGAAALRAEGKHEKDVILRSTADNSQSPTTSLLRFETRHRGLTAILLSCPSPPSDLPRNLTSSSMTSIERLPWGSLPLEYYVLSQWTSLATEDLGKRRRQLAQRFTAIGYRGRYLTVAGWASQSGPELPPQANWESILAPLRTDFQRQLASPYSFQPEGFHCWGIIWLRTCYDEGTDEAHQKLLSGLNQDLALEMEENILDDAMLYDYGDDWYRIFEVIPERLFEEVLGDIDIDMMTTPEDYETRIREAQPNLDIDEVTDIDAFKQATVRFHYKAVCKFLFISDKVALDTGKVLVVFFDDCGRTVRQSRVQPELCEEIAGAWFDCFINEMEVFTEADIGPEYLPGGLSGPPYAA